MKSWYENLYEIRNVTLIFQKRKKKNDGLPDYLWDNFFLRIS